MAEENQSEWIRGLNQQLNDPQLGMTPQEKSLDTALGHLTANYQDTHKTNPEAKLVALEFLSRLQHRTGSIPSGLSIEQLCFLDHTIRKLDESGPSALTKNESHSLFMAPATSEVAHEHGLPRPSEQEIQQSKISMIRNGSIVYMGLIEFLRHKDAEQAANNAISASGVSKYIHQSLHEEIKKAVESGVKESVVKIAEEAIKSSGAAVNTDQLSFEHLEAGKELARKRAEKEEMERLEAEASLRSPRPGPN